MIRSIYLLVKLFFIKCIYFNKINFVSPLVFIDGDFLIRKGRVIFKGKFRSRKYTYINVSSGILSIGNNVFFNRNVSVNVRESVTISDGVMLGEGVKIYDHDHARCDGSILKKKFISKEIFIGENSWIGTNVIILKGVRIGANVIVASGSIVCKNIPDNTVFIQKRISY